MHTFFSFVRIALLQSLKLFETYSRESQRLPLRIAPAELDRKSSAFRVYVPPSVNHFRQYGFQPVRSLFVCNLVIVSASGLLPSVLITAPPLLPLTLLVLFGNLRGALPPIRARELDPFRFILRR